MSKNKREYGVLAVVLLLIVLYSGCYVSRKAGFYVDEGMTLYLSNGTYTGAVTTVPDATIFSFVKDYVLKDSLSDTISNVRGMLSDVMGAGDYSVKGTVEWYDAARAVLQGRNTWMKGTDLYDMCTASRDNRFNYGQVYINQVMDVHPCVYYFLVHTVFSLFPGAYSDYFLYGINIVCLLATCILMYSICRKLGVDPAVALLGVAIYSFSQGFVSCAVFFRMYAVETLMVFVTFFYYMKLKDKNYELVRRDYIILGLIEITGFNVHYYYIIYLAALFAVVLADMIRKKINVKKYIISQIITGIISLIIWPFSMYHILFGYRGTEAFSRLKSFGLIKSITDYMSLCVDSLMFGWIPAGILIITGLGLYRFGRKKGAGSGDQPGENARPEAFWKELVIPMAVYLIVVGKVAPSASARYVMCLFPLLTMCMVMGVSALFRRIGLDGKVEKYVCLCISLFYIAATFAFKQPDYLYPEKNLTLGIDIDRAGTDCLMVASEHYKGFPYLLKLSEFDRVMVVDAYMLDTVENTRPDNEKENMLVYIDNTLDSEEILESLDRYGYLADRKITGTDSDLIDFSAFYLETE